MRHKCAGVFVCEGYHGCGVPSWAERLAGGKGKTRGSMEMEWRRPGCTCWGVVMLIAGSGVVPGARGTKREGCACCGCAGCDKGCRCAEYKKAAASGMGRLRVMGGI